MSHDNAEHRNNTNNINNTTNNNTLRRIPNAMDLRRLLRKCSYCKETGHNISSCNHPSLIQFGSICLFKKLELINNPSQFAQWLALTSIENINCNTLIKAYGISKHGCILRDNMHVVIEKITNKLYNLVENINEDYVRLPAMENISATSIFNEMISFNLMTSLLSPRSVTAPIHPEEEIVIKLIYDETVHKNVDSIECSICYETKNTKEIVQLNCNHSFCKCCTKQIVETKPNCPYCRVKIDKISFNTTDVYKYYVGEHNC
jgi:hypothetical protein